MSLGLRLLGDLGLDWQGRILDADLGQDATLLLAGLALAGGEARVKRTSLAAEIWPESPARDLRLTDALFELSQALPMADRFLRVELDQLSWRGACQVQVDALSFECLAKKILEKPTIEGLESVRAAYAGDLLPQIEGPWIAAQRDRLRGTYCATLAESAKLYDEAGRYGRARVCARRLARLRPLGSATRQLPAG